ncbi:MAG: hypothetical protein H7328_10630 [Bdellovibrio sp.]|nr:hypothetical protein [Bdellovibrio sp.]
MPIYIVKALLQEVTDEDIYQELDTAMADEEGYPYITDENEKIYALPLDTFEFDVEIDAKALLNVVKLICATIEKKHKLKKTPIMVIETAEMQVENLEELSDEDFE